MAISRFLRCPNPYDHRRVDHIDDNGEKVFVRTRRICGHIFKIFDPKASFEEIVMCPVCGAHIKFDRKANGLTTAYVIDRKLQIEGEDETVLLIGEFKRKRSKRRVVNDQQKKNRLRRRAN